MAILAAVMLPRTVVAGTVTVTVTPSVGPNGFGSPNYNAYVANATHALLFGLSSYGDVTLPSYYAAASSISAADAVVTGFPSWHGQADPATVFGSAYSSELGNRPLFGVVVNGNGQKVSISGLGFSGAGDDPGNMLGFGFATGGYGYSTSYMGVVFDQNGDFGSFVTSGANTQLVDMIVGRGSGNALAAYCVGCTIAQQQDAINQAAWAMNTVDNFTGSYTYTEGGNVLASGSGTFNVTDVATPEPGTIALLFAGMAAFGWKRRAAVKK